MKLNHIWDGSITFLIGENSEILIQVSIKIHFKKTKKLINNLQDLN